MTHDDIIAMAREAGFMQHLGVIAIPNIQNLERFIALVRADEREKLCKRLAMLHDELSLASVANVGNK